MKAGANSPSSGTRRENSREGRAGTGGATRRSAWKKSRHQEGKRGGLKETPISISRGELKINGATKSILMPY